MAARILVGSVGAGLVVSAGLAFLASPMGADPVRPFPGARTTEEARIELGRRLFFDPIASRSQARSCASCHDPEHGFSDPSPRSDDDIARTARHSQTLLDVHLNPTSHWDGEFDSIEELVTARLGAVAGIRGTALSRGAHGPLGEVGDPTGLGVPPPRSSGGGYGNPTPPPDRTPGRPDPNDPLPVRPGDPEDADPAVTTPSDDDAEDGSGGSKPDLKDRPGRKAKDQVRTLPLDLTRLPDVARTLEDSGRYDEAFQAAFGSRQVTTARLAEAIADYCRSIRSTEAPIDRYLAGEREALSPAARRGLDLFRGRAGCVQCHTLDGARPTLTDFEFHNTGVVWSGRNGQPEGDDEVVDLDRVLSSDHGRETFSRSTGDRRAFKTPTLRDLTRRGPYMHDGSFRSLESVVRYYAAGAAGGPQGDAKQDKRLRTFKASDDDLADLVAFLEALTGDDQPGRAPRAWHARRETQRVRVLDAKGRPLVGLPVMLQPEGDLLPVAGRERAQATEAFTDPEGWLSFAPSCRTHTRLALPEGLLPAGGALVPDTSAETTLRVPVDGRVTLVVTFEPGADAPERLVAEHELTMRLPGHGAPRTHFQRVALLEVGGRQVGSYEGWRRTDLPPDVIVRFPGDRRARPEHRLTLSGEGTQRLDL